LDRSVRVSEQVGIAAVLVDAKDDKAASFYKHFGFLPFPEAPHRLVMAIQTAATLFGS
jgi:hypothetical protein